MRILSTNGTVSAGGVDKSIDMTKAGPLLFDNCQLGMVLRAFVLVELTVGIAIMFIMPTLPGWLTCMVTASGVALPATVAWLITGCACKWWLYGKSYPFQLTLGALLGAIFGAAAAFGLPLIDHRLVAPWLPASLAGAGFALLLILQASLRRNAVIPENTTAQLKQLQARIQPHFLFNALNSAIALVNKEPEKAEVLLQDLSDLFRHAISKSNTTLTLEEEIKLVQQYLAIEKIRFGDRMVVHWRIDPDTLDTIIVPLMLQPLVENAVKHGVEPSTSECHIWIKTTAKASMIEISVVNTVPDGELQINTRPSMGIGLRNVAQRLQLFYDIEGRLEAKMVDGRYMVHVKIPKKTAIALRDNHSTFV